MDILLSGSSSVGRASAFQAECRGFDPRLPLQKTLMKKSWSRFQELLVTQKIFPCPSCGTRLRVPVKSGKRLQVKCPRCGNTCEIYFQSPFAHLAGWDKKASVFQNIGGITKRFSELPLRFKLSFLLFVFCCGVFIWLLISPRSVAYDPAGNEPQPQTQPDIRREFQR